jgi:hypothetical protein
MQVLYQLSYGPVCARLTAKTLVVPLWPEGLA